MTTKLKKQKEQKKKLKTKKGEAFSEKIQPKSKKTESKTEVKIEAKTTIPEEKPKLVQELKPEIIKESSEKKDYTVEDIYVLEGLDPVRKRPGMYIGTTGLDGLHHLIWECFDNCLDEAMAGYAKNIEVILLPSNKVKVKDDGRGIPVEIHPQTKKSALETVLTTLHAGAKFGSKAYQVAGGLHGVGVSVVCALSKWMKAEVCRQGFLYSQEYSKGKVITKVKKIGPCEKPGTTMTFEPDEGIFKEGTRFELKKILKHLRQQSYLTSKVKISVRDERTPSYFSYNFYFEGGIKSYIRYLLNQSEPLHKNIFFTKGEKEGIQVEAALQYAKELESLEEGFANNIFNGEGGTHLTGLRTALTRTLNDYARKNGFLKEKEENLTGNDVREGLLAVISVKIREPQFEGQTKSKLGSPEVKPAVESVISEGLSDFLEKHPQDAKAIIENCLLSLKARQAAQAAKTAVLRKGVLEGLTLPGKLADCSSRKPEESEIYLVEGDSAGGCFSENTKVALTDGRALNFRELIKEYRQGKRNYCYTIREDSRIGISEIRNPRLTKKSAKVIKIVLDNDEEITCTPDHKFMLKDASYKEAQNLTIQDSLMPFRRQLSKLGKRITIKGYELVYDPKEKRWIFTHLLVDEYNLKHGKYLIENGDTIHHIDFNKLNNNPDNLIRMPKMEHFLYHTKFLGKTIHREDIKEKVKKIHQSKIYREKIRKIMLVPKMQKMLSERAKKQWENQEYKQYMVQKFLEFYKKNKNYREKNRKLLYENQKKYWNNPNNRKKQSEKVKEYFERHPEKKKEFSERAKRQWQDENLLKWRLEKTKKQWTVEFRKKRKEAYNQTYQDKALKLMKEIFEKYGDFIEEEYNQERRKRNDKSLLRYDTICQRFFGNNKERLKEAVLNYNHKIKKIIKLKKRINVYDLEVPNTHNFALASGIFVHNSGKQARDRKFQAILPLRGKILNVEKARLDKLLDSKEVKSLIIALGTAIAEDFNIAKLRYHRIIVMADADSDGNHIRTLLLTLFYRYFRPLIEAGYVYLAQPPLYKIQMGKKIEYAYSDTQKEKILSSYKKIRDKTNVDEKQKKKKEEEAGEKIEEKIKSVSIQRYKGLGEMNPEELWETTMNPANRILLKVTIEDAKEADHIFDVLMGKEVLPRKKFIQAYAQKVRNLDI